VSRIDAQEIHNDDIGPIVGLFHNTPIRSWYPASTDERNNEFARTRIAAARAYETTLEETL
jgi:hypothetical protein